MSTTHDGLDPRTASSATTYGDVAHQRWVNHVAAAPLHLLAAHGMATPGHTFDPDDQRETKTTRELPDGSRLHQHQRVHEPVDDAGGPLAGMTDTDPTVWLCVDVDPITVTVIGDWGKRRTISPEAFVDEYEQATTSDGEPVFDY
jgi:hypothetical protein